jgi:MFS family permease
MTCQAPPAGRLLATPAFPLLWSVGVVTNVLRWLEVLAAALFTLDATGSEVAVAAVVAARSLPLVFMGAVAGVLADAIDRKLILVGGMLLSAASSGAVAALAWAGVLQPWHLFAASLVGGLVYGTDMSVRRRMVGESVAPPLVARAVALDSLAGSASRAVGPLIGGATYQFLGIAGAFTGSAVLGLLAAVMAARVRHVQIPRTLSAAAVVGDLLEGIRAVRTAPVLLALVGGTVAMNLFGFAYTSLVAPLGRDVFAVSDSLVGVLAAAEPAGATLGGLALAVFGAPPGRPIWYLLGGAGSFLAAMTLIPLAPWFWPASLLLFAGGTGISVYSNVQVTIALAEAPAGMRSRVMGLLTMAVGTWPFGMLLAGWLAGRTGPLAALGVLGTAGLCWVAGVALRFRAAERRMRRRRL